MCGIFGLVAGADSELTFRDTRTIVNELFVLSETRGKESSGLAVKNGSLGEIGVFKAPLPATALVRTNEYREFFEKSLHGCFSSDKIRQLRHPFSLIAHARLVTNGTQQDNFNNQPVNKSGAVAVHNGIIVNVDQLWSRYREFQRQYEVDTEILIELLCSRLRQNASIPQATEEAFRLIEGAASIGMLFDDRPALLMTTNTGSLYYIHSATKGTLIFSSERYILESLVANAHLPQILGPCTVRWVHPNEGWVIDEMTADLERFSIGANGGNGHGRAYAISTARLQIKDCSPRAVPARVTTRSASSADASLLEYNIEEISRLRRCSRCLLPETFPFITYDKDGVCNYCLNYEPQVILGLDELKKYVSPYRKTNGEPDCLVTFSGGRDSSFGLHLVARELDLTPIAYTYDWGMVTDLARRNQARLCGKLGIEHILISADINRKRTNIRKNVEAWLKSPSLGTVPLFMAGDKQYFYYANKLKRINRIDLVILCENMLEKTDFKSGFCGIAPTFGGAHIYTLSPADKLKMIAFYGKEYLSNPAYLNQSLIDTVGAFASYYFIPHKYLNIYKYVRWEEKTVERTLIGEYNWEISPDTQTTWRIGDGTAPFYNYIYYTISGFSEIDTFRSNQIREGMLSREEALKAVNEENKARFESIKWYLDTIGLDFNSTIRRINSAPKLYRNG